MKKIINCAAVVVALAVSVLTMGCLSTGAKNFSYQEKASELGPENAVVFYGFYYGNQELTYTQDDENFDFDKQELKSWFIVSAPVALGSQYHCEYLKGVSFASATSSEKWDAKLPLDYKIFDIKVPKKPGLYYCGSFDVRKTLKEGRRIPYAKTEDLGFMLGGNWDEIEQEKMVLSEAKKLYKGTSWEPLINTRISELETKK